MSKRNGVSSLQKLMSLSEGVSRKQLSSSHFILRLETALAELGLIEQTSNVALTATPTPFRTLAATSFANLIGSRVHSGGPPWNGLDAESETDKPFLTTLGQALPPGLFKNKKSPATAYHGDGSSSRSEALTHLSVTHTPHHDYTHPSVTTHTPQHVHTHPPA